MAEKLGNVPKTTCTQLNLSTGGQTKGQHWGLQQINVSASWLHQDNS